MLDPAGTSGSRRLGASTFAELIATILVLTLFSAAVFALYWSETRMAGTLGKSLSSEEGELALARTLPGIAARVRVPLWGNSRSVFTREGERLRVAYWDGSRDAAILIGPDDRGIFRIEGPGLDMTIGSLGRVAVDFWRKEGRIIGCEVEWIHDGRTRRLRAAWGALPL